jgi:hypothetical protein
MHRPDLDLFLGVMDDRVLVFVVDLNSEELFDTFGGPHLDCIPRHPLTNVHANLAPNAFVKSDLHIGYDDVHAARHVAWRMFDAIDGTEADAGFTPGTIVRDDHRDLFGLLLLSRNLSGRFGNDQRWICFFGIVCHV